jgi:hypothetical protein
MQEEVIAHIQFIVIFKNIIIDQHFIFAYNKKILFLSKIIFFVLLVDTRPSYRDCFNCKRLFHELVFASFYRSNRPMFLYLYCASY